MGEEIEVLARFWGKARPQASSEAEFHPLLAHAIDVAAVAQELSFPAGLPRSTLGFLVALHDIGKLSESFQAKVPSVWPSPPLSPWSGAPSDRGHDTSGFHLLNDAVLDEDFDRVLPDWSPSERAILWRALAGHHGRPPSGTAPLASQLGRQALPLARTFIRVMRDCFSPEPWPLPETEAEVIHAAWRVAGATVLADWIGSSQRFFPYVPAGTLRDPQRYLEDTARPRARDAIQAAGLATAGIAPFEDSAVVLGTRTPTPLQRWAELTALPEGPSLAVIEDMTGAGKTEAALILAHRFMAAGMAEGIFIALPTMATANGMYGRMRNAYRRLFSSDTRPSLALAHGRAELDAAFRATILGDMREEPGPAGETAGVECAAWLADDRRASLLAQVGVGTIDQALLSVLPVRHAPLRQRGLARKVLVVDEAHAFDPYMREEMLALLRFHAALGGSAIVLSATLTHRLRQKMVMAFQDGLGVNTSALSSTAYPLATLAGRTALTETPCEVREGLGRFTPFRRIDDGTAAMDEIMLAHDQGAAVAWVRNTVDEAIAAAEALRRRGIEPLVFHARFAMVDRLRIEAEVLRRFGPTSTPSDRACVLVATQVVEQSLDLDFDLLVTDLAPADLLIQRAGRLWRHRERDSRPLPKPEVLLLSPEPIATPDGDWLRDHGGTLAVYRDPALLWRSARAVLGAEGIEAPSGLRALIEAAGDETEVPPALALRAERAGGKAMAEAQTARQNVLSPHAPYSCQAGSWADDIHTPTRLEDQPQITLRLARWKEGRLVPYADDPDERRAWAMSEVSVAASRLTLTLTPTDERTVAQQLQARSTWGKWEREATQIAIAILEEEANDGLIVSNATSTHQPSQVRYDARRGLILLSEADV